LIPFRVWLTLSAAGFPVENGVVMSGTTKREILLGRYAVLEELQAGGMASIYKARDLETDGLVAIKRFDRDLHLPELEAEAYRREVEALKNLSHQNILRIIDHAEDDRHKPFLVLEWMSHDLVEHKQRGSSAFHGWDDFADQVAIPLADALAHAHANGFCHRDVKPANILIADTGTVKLADFGISKLKRCLQPRITLNEFISRPFAPPEPDDGAFTYSRDVFAFAVVCLWALSENPIREYADIAPALAQLDVVKDIREIITRCLSTDPSARQETAGVLSHELARLQSKRRQVWIAHDRKHCRARITNAARDAVANHLESSDEGAIQRFAEQDINDEATVNRVYTGWGTPQQRLISEQYFIYGSRFTYKIAIDNLKADHLAIISAQLWDTGRLQKMKESGLPVPVTFDIVPRPGAITANEAVKIFDMTLAEFEEREGRDKARKEEEALFHSWKNILDARAAYERERCAPVRFRSSRVEGQFVTLEVVGTAEGVELDQSRVIETEGKWIAGDVCEVAGNRVVLNCRQPDLTQVPKAGRARLDTRANDRAIERQRLAVESVRNSSAVRSDIRKLLLDPSTARSPSPENEGFLIPAEALDASQRDAILSALAIADMLLIQGPPGTGKTRVIVHLIRETLAKNPRARILLTSQTHVAIDNALEWLAKVAPDLKMLRIARAGPLVVSEFCHPYLVDNQFDQWRGEVASGSVKWLEEWARGQKLDPDEIATGSHIKRMADLENNITRLREFIQDCEKKLEVVGRKEATSGPESPLPDPEAIQREADEYRIQLDSDKKYLEQLELQLRRKRKDADEFLKMSPTEKIEWSEALVGDSEEGRRTAAVLDLQAAWLDCFGRNDAFNGALCERSSVVAATCIGLASLPGTDEVAYDLCIFDEASKATATEALVPMVRAKKWVFVGDSRQLPPFEDEVHRNGELQRRFDIDSETDLESLFERLRRLLPVACQKMLRKQYRMVPPIGRLISDCFYDSEVESNERPLDPRLVSVTEKAVTWITTRYLDDRREERADPSYVNPSEVNRILDLLDEVERAVRDDDDEKVTVQLLSGYSAQVQLLRRQVDGSRHSFPHLEIECSTIDTVQGREAHVVIFSVTRSNDDLRAGFLGEIARINVALSRACELLIIVGDDEFVRRANGAEPLCRVLHHIDQHPEECNLQAFDLPGELKGGHR
jgi:tRNA A-37 threonylcarbamoyl transferase component Bud32